MSATASLAAERPPFSSCELLGAKEAGLFYENACSREGLHVHSTFLKQLLLGSVLIQFENGYLGGNGISPIVQTLQRIPLRALLLSKCALSAEDIKLLCVGLAAHPQLEKIDVRGVTLTVGGAKELQHLAVCNTNITEILMDEGLPKYVAIQQQCQRNAQAASLETSACVVCGAGVHMSTRASCETLVLHFIMGRLKPQSCSISAACMTMLCSALQQCVDRNDGILSVCGATCAETLAEDLCRCVWSVSKALVWKMPFDIPKTPFLRVFLFHKQAQFQRDTSTLEASSNLPKSFFQPGPVDARSEECWRTKKPRKDIEEFFDNGTGRDVASCTICGQPGVCSTDGATWLLRTLQIDMEEHGVSVTPAALLRLCRIFAAHACVRPCSRRCLRHLVRYALYGYGGVNCSYVGGFPPLTSILGGVLECLQLPLVDFTVVDIATETVQDVGNEEINCALTVASAVSDTDGLEMDPYLIFSIGRQLRKMSAQSIGVDLASVCEAARLVGCLPEEASPYKRSCGNADSADVADGASVATAAPPVRDLIADWSAWSTASGHATVKRWLHTAFAHRRQRVCAIDGPHRDLFDNIRAALWALRHQSRSVLVTLKVSVSWLSLKDGVVPLGTSCRTHGFCTTVKVIGQSTRSNTVYLILQCPLGKHVGHNGFLYMPKTVFLQCVRGLAFVFADAVTMEYREAGWRASLYAKKLVGPALGLPRDFCVQRLRQLFVYVFSYAHGRRCMEGAAWNLVGSRVSVEELRRLFGEDQLPSPLAFLRDALDLALLDSSTTVSGGQRNEACSANRTYCERVLFSSRYASQLLFYFSEILGSGRWLQQALEATATVQAQPVPVGSAPPNVINAGPRQKVSPLRGGTAAASTREDSRNSDGAGYTWNWQTLGSVPELCLLSCEPALVADAVAMIDETPVPAKVARKKGNVQAVTAASVVAGDKASTSRLPKPPKSQSPAQLSSRRHVSVVPSAPNEPSPSSPNSTVTTSRSAFTGKSTQPTEKAPANAATVNTASIVGSGLPTAQQDKVQNRLQNEWRTERALLAARMEDATRLGVGEFLYRRTPATPIESSPLSEAETNTPKKLRSAHNSNDNAGSSSGFQDAHDGDIPAHLLGKPWLVIPVELGECNGGGEAALPDLHLLFIGNSVSVYSMHNSRLLCHPTLMSADALMAEFPFATGVDAATLSPVNANLAFFFSGRDWLLFDLKLMECVDGPYPLSMHGQFRKLPAAFHEGVDGVIAIPNSSKMVFFRGFSYVVFDVLMRRCVGGVGLLHLPLPSTAERDAYTEGLLLSVNASTYESPLSHKEEKDDDPLYAAFSASRPFAAFNQTAADSARGKAAALRSGRSVEADNDTMSDGGVPPTSCPLHITPELQRLLGTAPMSWFMVRNSTPAASAGPVAAAAEQSISHWLVNRRGEVVEVEWELKTILGENTAIGDGAELTSKGAAPQWELRCRNENPAVPVSQPPFSNLPLVFRQSSPNALPVLCALAVNKNFALEDHYQETTGYAHDSTKGGCASPASSKLELFDPECGLRAPSSVTMDSGTRGGRFSSPSSPTAMDSPTSANRHGASSSCAEDLPEAAPMTTTSTAGNEADASDTMIMSSLAWSSVAQRMPLALSRIGPATAAREGSGSIAAAAACRGWGREVLLYEGGSTVGLVASQQGGKDRAEGGGADGGLGAAYLMGEQPGKAACPRHFIEYDLGLSAPRRSFSALLLVLDTSLLPPVLLQLAPLVATVECSIEGEVHFPQAVLRIAGPVTAAKWGGGPLSMEPEAARFWRLRFETPIPAALGIVRLFWFEAPRGSPHHSMPSVALPSCVTLPLVVRAVDANCPTNEGIAAGGGDGVPPVSVEAECVLASPELLLRSENALPVIVDNPSARARGWYGYHTAFPLLGQRSSTCRMCCGASFLEVCLEKSRDSNSTVRGGACDAGLSPSPMPQCFTDHRSFAGLPYPFALGWDANFYPSPREHPGLLCLIRGDTMVEWDMEEGRACSSAMEWRKSVLCEGLSATPIARVIAAFNCWLETDGNVVAFLYEPSSASLSCEVQYLEYDLLRREVVRGPVKLATHLRTRYGASLPSPLSEHTLLTVLCSPLAPSTLYLFYERMVQVLSVKSPGATEAPLEASTHAVSMTESPVFYAVLLQMPTWGSRQRRCHITLDLASLLMLPPLTPANDDDDDVGGEHEGVLIAGMQLVSSGGRSGCATCWRVQCSEHGRIWEDVAVHRQHAGERVVGETKWVPRAAGRCCRARFWRFQRISCSGCSEGREAVRDSSDDYFQSYSQLRLLSIPRRRCLQAPIRVSGTDVGASSTDACGSFFTKGTRAMKLALRRRADDSITASPFAGGNGVYELVWDYGLSLIVLSGLTFTVENKPANAQLKWTLYGSTATETAQWDPVATTTVTSDATRYSLSWVPNGWYRYWCLACEATWIPNHSGDSHGLPASLILSAFHVYDYEGPLVSLQHATGAFLPATSLLWPSARKCFSEPSDLASAANHCVLLSRIADALTWCKIDFLVGGDCSAGVVAEWSADAAEWFTVDLATFSINGDMRDKVQETVLSWQCCGPKRLWRIRVLGITSDMSFLPLGLHLGTSPAEHLVKLSPKALLFDASAQLQLVACTPAPSRRASVQMTADKRSSLGSSVVAAGTSVVAAAAAGGGVGGGAATTDLCLESPKRFIGVRAALPSLSSRYAVEYLGLDGASWISAAVLEARADTEKELLWALLNSEAWAPSVTTAATSTSAVMPQRSLVASVWWDGASVPPSTQWRLRPLSKDGSSSASSQQPQQQKAHTVEWFAEIGTVTKVVDTSDMSGVRVNTTGFNEVQPPHYLSGSERAAFTTVAGRAEAKAQPVLQCVLEPSCGESLPSISAVRTVTWSFISPVQFDQLSLRLCATLQTGETSDEEEVQSKAAVQNLWVETSDNGEDFVVVGHALWGPTDTAIVLTWEEVPPAAFWRLRLSAVVAASTSPSPPPPLPRYLLEISAARWGIRRCSPGLTAQVCTTPLGGFTNTAYRAWLTDRFNHEAAFMRDCQEAFDEARSVESKLRTEEELSASAMVAVAVQRMRVKYQKFIQKTAKLAARQFRISAADDKAAASAVTANAIANYNSTNSENAIPVHSSSSSLPHPAYARWLSPAHASSDVMFLLLESAASPLLGGEKLMQLAELVSCPLAFRDAFKFTKKGARWFYPCLEVIGQMAQEWCGFPPESVCASFSVYWSLSSALQRRRDVLLVPKDLILPLSEHVASPLVVVQINEVHWLPSKHFPGVPFLYATNFNDRPTTVVFALNDVVFTPPYALGVPSAKESQALTSAYPYTVYAGVNFVQTRTLDSCPAPAFDVLRFIFPPSMFTPAFEEKGGKKSGRRRSKNPHGNRVPLLMVLTTSSLQQGFGSSGTDGVSAQLRFTAPAEGVNFGVRGLVIDTLEFEITMTADGPAKRWTYQTTFVSHGARFVAQGGDDEDVPAEVPVSLLGSVETHGLPVVTLSGSLGNARITAVAGIPGAVATNLTFHTVAQAEKIPSGITGISGDESGAVGVTAPQWACFPLQCEGLVTLPGLPYSNNCTCILSLSDTVDDMLAVSQLRIALDRCSLSEVQAFCHACGGKDSGDNSSKPVAPMSALSSQRFSMCGVHVELAAFLEVAAAPLIKARSGRNNAILRGQGLLYIDNSVLQGATVEMDCVEDSVTVMATCSHSLRFGPIIMQGTEENPISLQLVLSGPLPSIRQAPQEQLQLCSTAGNAGATYSGSHQPCASYRMLIAGSAYVFGRQQLARVSLELLCSSDAGCLATLVAHSVSHSKLEAILQDSTVVLAWRYAQVTVDESSFRQALARELGSIPIVAALCAHGIPLACVVSSVTASPFDLATQRLSLRVKGLLFGASFDVLVAIASPDDGEDVWSVIAARACPEVVEQCEENLWASYANVVGCRLQAPQETEAQ
ncbi:hypothetical protein ABL78_6848 [Leptomonas seymouri]|uniref:Uncharacterized protein n=1 Tax=Leptomonas seymouri TaxID=5684 RepID=A0A0N1I0A1_LEPSE|nr:hypothetical protein ABL78_6848 [Leptomonas seymouri]|eukprot:KPI84092.1 hypothetical protein ABL78_6848 [Leptomonas seymouri]